MSWWHFLNPASASEGCLNRTNSHYQSEIQDPYDHAKLGFESDDPPYEEQEKPEDGSDARTVKPKPT